MRQRIACRHLRKLSTILPCITFVSEDYIRYIRWLSKRARLWVHIGKSLFGWVGANTPLLSPHVYKYCLSFHHLSLLPTSHISNDYSALILLPNPKSHPPSTLITSALDNMSVPTPAAPATNNLPGSEPGESQGQTHSATPLPCKQFSLPFFSSLP